MISAPHNSHASSALWTPPVGCSMYVVMRERERERARSKSRSIFGWEATRKMWYNTHIHVIAQLRERERDCHLFLFLVTHFNFLRERTDGGNDEGRQYGLILFVSFGAAIFGVMLLHKLREGRIFNLIVQEKDNQLVYLHRLLQVSLSLHGCSAFKYLIRAILLICFLINY